MRLTLTKASIVFRYYWLRCLHFLAAFRSTKPGTENDDT